MLLWKQHNPTPSRLLSVGAIGLSFLFLERGSEPSKPRFLKHPRFLTGAQGSTASNDDKSSRFWVQAEEELDSQDHERAQILGPLKEWLKEEADAGIPINGDVQRCKSV